MRYKTKETELFHYGVKGMKWGKRKSPLTTVTSAVGVQRNAQKTLSNTAKAAYYGVKGIKDPKAKAKAQRAGSAAAKSATKTGKNAGKVALSVTGNSPAATTGRLVSKAAKVVWNTLPIARMTKMVEKKVKKSAKRAQRTQDA